MDQPFGDGAQGALSNLVQEKQIWVSVVDIDRYGRTVAHILTEDRNVDAMPHSLAAAMRGCIESML
jgi:endonuclease YncB( thermonuclease family)